MSDNDLIRRGDVLKAVGRNVLGSETAVAAIRALPAVDVAGVRDEIHEITDADYANIIAHLSHELEPTGPLPNRNSLMMEVVRLRNAANVVIDTPAAPVTLAQALEVPGIARLVEALQMISRHKQIGFSGAERPSYEAEIAIAALAALKGGDA